jgi:hypothetical protein
MKKKKHITVNVMAPLLVGDPKSSTSVATIQARDRFRRDLSLLKNNGFNGAIATDLWAALVEPQPGKFEWAIYDWLLDTLIEFGFKWAPIDSEHQCGGNVGDDVFIPVAQWVWDYLVSMVPGSTARDFMFVSEQGNACPEYVGFWADQLMMPLRIRRWKAFCEHFADRAQHIAEINISLGPAGELRYPSYNSHDKNTDYPTRGALQCYSSRAVNAFQQFATNRYRDAAGIDIAWGTNIAQGQLIGPPANPCEFFRRADHSNTRYGRDLFDFYSEGLRNHGRDVLQGAFSIFAADDSPMKGIDIGVKLPGIHWLTGHWEFDRRVISQNLAIEVAGIISNTGKKKKPERERATDYGDHLARRVTEYIRNRTSKWSPEVDGGELIVGSRLAELTAGLIRTSDSRDWLIDETGRGYRPLIKMFSEFAGRNNRLVLHFTCLEMADGEGAWRGADSVANSLVKWVGAEAARQGVPIKGENALGPNLQEQSAWERMRSHLCADGPFEGLTILRMAHLNTPLASAELAKTIAYASTENEARTRFEAA